MFMVTSKHLRAFRRKKTKSSEGNYKVLFARNNSGRILPDESLHKKGEFITGYKYRFGSTFWRKKFSTQNS